MNSVADVWDNVLSQLKGELSETTIATWFDELEAVDIQGNTFILHCSNDFKKGYIESLFMKNIKASLHDIFSTDFEVKILDDLDYAELKDNRPHRQSERFTSAEFTFETFVVGPSNKLAYAASVSVAEHPAQNYNPLLIYGDSGLGKTHLLYAIANSIHQNKPGLSVVYVKGDTFTNELILSIQNNKNEEFRNKYRNIDVLLIDDIQFISKKEGTQEEFFHTFNALYESNKQIIISSDRPPKEIKTLEDRLRSRFEWGLIADIQPPDYETRIAILRKKADRDNLHVPDEVMAYIAKNIVSNIRELEGSLNKLIALANLENKPIDIPLAAEALKDMISPNNTREITPELIIEVVSDHFNVPAAELKGKKRNAEIVLPRQIVMYLCRKMTDTPLKTIGLILGGKDHASVSHGVKKIEHDVKTDEALNNTVNIIKKKLNPI